MEKYGNIWKNIEKYGKLWKNMEKYGIIWNNMEQYGIIWKTYGKHMENIWKDMEQMRNNPE